MKKPIEFSLIFFLAAIYGCMPSQGPGISGFERVPQDAPAPVYFDDIAQKIRFYNQLLEEKTVSEQDRKTAMTLLDSYEKLQRLNSTQPTGLAYSNLLQELYANLDAIDEAYFNERRDAKIHYSNMMRLYADKREQIINAHLSGDDQSVMALCIELKTLFGPDALTPDIGLLFAMSLANNGMADEAIAVGEGIARVLETRPNILQLRTRIAEWYLQQGQPEKAVSEYEKLADTLDERVMALRTLNNKIDLAKKTTPVINSGLKPEMLPSEKLPIDQVLIEVDQLLEQNRFNEARNLLFIKKNQIISSSDAEALEQALNKVVMAEEDYLEAKISRISMQTDMEYARKLLEEEKYEEVIERLEAMDSDEENSREINSLKQYAVEKLINRERNRAAKLFLSAKRTKDPVQKKEALLQALAMLHKLIEQYPSSPLIEKLISNANIVEEEIEKLD